MRRIAFLLRVVVGGWFVTAPLIATAAVYRCIGTDGKTTLQQVPCVGPVAGGDSRSADEALRNAGGDRELAATIQGCRGVDKSSPHYSRCSAVLACTARGYVDAELRSCLRRAAAHFAEEQSVWEAAQRQRAVEDARLAAETREMTDRNNPRHHIKAGQVFANGDFVKLIDSKYPGTEWYADQSVAIPFGNGYYIVKSEKVNDTDVPAKYRVVTIVRSEARPELTAMAISGKPNYRPATTATRSARTSPSSVLSPVSCSLLDEYAKLKGHNFIERAAIIGSAKTNGLCV